MGIIAHTPTGYEIHDTGGPGRAWSCSCGKCWVRYERPKTGQRVAELKRRLLPCWHLSRWFDEVADGTISSYFTLTDYGIRRSETCECGPNGAPPWIDPPRPAPVRAAKNSKQRSKERRARKFRRLQERARDLGLSDDPTQGRDGIERAIEAELERLAGERRRREELEELAREERRRLRTEEEQARLEDAARRARERAHELAEDRRMARETGAARRVLSRAEKARAEVEARTAASVERQRAEAAAKAAKRSRTKR